MPNSPRLTMPYIVTGQAQKEITHNDALNDLDSLAQISVINRTTATPPTTPAEGDSYIIAASPTGAWAGNANAVASYYSGWRIKPAKTGWLAYVQAESIFYIFDGTAWNVFKGVVPLGSAAAPSYSFVGDSDTGIYSPGANQLSIATAGIQRVAVDAAGTTTVSGILASANHTITSNSASAMAIGANGATNPALQVDASVASHVNGIKMQAVATGGTPIIQAIGTDTNVPLALISKGTSFVRASNSSASVSSPSLDKTLVVRNLSNTINNSSSIGFSNSGNFYGAQIDGVNESQTANTGSLVFYTGVAGTLTQAMKIDSSSNVVVNTAAIATTATNGFLYIPTCAGAPTGVPTTYTGRAPIVFDTTNNKLCIYNGTWKTVTLI
jgi:Protein of unknown function (DUF2793)